MEGSPLTVVHGGLGVEALPASRAARIPSDSAMRRLLAAGDAVGVATALIGAHLLLGHQFPNWTFLAVPVMLVLFKLYGLYDRDAKRIGYSTVDDLPWLAHAVLVGVLLLWLLARYTPMHTMDVAENAVFGLGTILLVCLGRVTSRRFAGKIIGEERAVIVGIGDTAVSLFRKLQAHPEYRLKVVGVLCDQGIPSEATDQQPRFLGVPDDLGSVVDRYGIARAVLSAPDLEANDIEELLRRCRALKLKVSVLPRLSDVLGSAVEIDDIEGITALGLSLPSLPRSSRAIKRAIDVAIATVSLVLLAPLLLLLAIAIKLESRGPVLFSQERVGTGGKRFRVLKLRTMVADAENRRAALLSESVDPNWLLLQRDPRITRVGRSLRRLSIDELPQLWNVLRGEMSMVGPRPLIPAEDERVQHWARGRLDLTPGITGYWQVLGRTRIPFDEMVKLDYLYVTNWSLWEDLKLMLKTLPTVVGGRGAN
jgi:exopolysaccharide biosynthesis polyprenyl glycosylphosphotransferase